MPDHAVLMLCLGNICRSPMAQGALEAEAARLGLDLHVDSAGTGDWHVGAPPDPRAVAAAARRGFEISAQRARKATAQDFDRFDLIVGMEQANLDALARLRPGEGGARLALLLDHAPAHAGQAVPDPFFDGEEAFDHALALIELGVAGLVETLRARR